MPYDVVLFTGCKSVNVKTFGAYKCAHELRQAGFRTLVVNHLHDLDINDLKRILSCTVGPDTLFVGMSNTFLDPVRQAAVNPLRDIKTVYQSILPHGPEIEQQFVDHIRSLNARCRIVVGGTRTFFNINNPNIDYAIIGYADVSIVNLANHLKHDRPLPNAKRNINRLTVIDDPNAENFDFVNSSMIWTPDDVIIPGETLPLEISRGCVFNCSFCTYRLRGKQKLDYLKRYDILRDELVRNYETYGTTTYRLLDDTYNDTREKIDIMLQMVKSLPFQPKFWSYIRLDLLSKHPETVDKIIDTGIVSMYFGIETLNKSTGRMIGKGYDPEKQVETIRRMKDRYGDSIHLHGSFICGLPGESTDSIRTTVQRLLDRDVPLDSFYYQPLFINKNEFETWQSAFGLDLEKFGYQEIPWPQSDSVPESINWQSPIMNYLEAKSMCAEFRLRSLKTHPIKHGLRPAESPVNHSHDYLDRYKNQLFSMLEAYHV